MYNRTRIGLYGDLLIRVTKEETMSQLRLLPTCAWLLCIAAVAHADQPRDLLKRVQTTILARQPLVAEGALTIEYNGAKPTISVKCCRFARDGSINETWSYQAVPMDQVPPFLIVMPNPLVHPLDPVPDNLLQANAGKAGGQIRDLGKERIKDVDYEVVEINDPHADIGQPALAGPPIIAKSVVRKLYIGQDNLIHRISGEVDWTQSDPIPNAKGAPPAPVQHVKFTLEVTSYRPAIMTPPRPASQPPVLSVQIKQDNDPNNLALALSRDGSLLVRGASGGDIHLIDTRTSQEKTVLTGHLDRIIALAVSPDAKRLVSADRMIMAVWNLETGKLLYTLKDQPEVHDITFAPDGRSVLAVRNNGPMQIIDITTGKTLHAIDVQIPNRFTFSPDGAYLATLDGAEVKLWNARTWQPVAISDNNVPAGGQIAFSPDSARFALPGYPGHVYVFDAHSGRRLQVLKGAPGNIHAVWFSADGRSISALDADQRGDVADSRPGVTTWDTVTWQVVGSLSLNGSNTHVDMGGLYGPGNTIVFPDWLGQMDASNHIIKFWQFPISPLQP
jgi:WD40 repeat protein